MYRFRDFILAASTVLIAATGARAADCSALLADFQDAVAAKALDRAETLERKISSDVVCSARGASVRSGLLVLAEDLLADPATPSTVRAAATKRILAGEHSPQNTLKVADVLFAQHRFRDAATFYETSIALSGSPSVFTAAEKRRVLSRATAAKMLASNDEEGTKPATFAGSSRAPDGTLGGIYAPQMKGPVPVAVPLPINFVFDSTKFTPVGEKAATELLEFLKQNGDLTEITLVGHTDPRGTAEYNMQLSKQRLVALADFLSQNGVKITMKLVPKGKSEPFDVSVLPYKPTQEEIWALDRRVELMR